MKKRKICIWLAVLGMTLCVTGCGQQSSPVVVIENEAYEKVTYRTTEVLQGDLDPSIELSMKAEGYKMINYTIKTPDLTLEKVWVSVGDKVKEGDLLVSFQSEALQDTIDGYQEQIAGNELLIEHYTKLMQIDPEADYTTDIEMLQQDNVVAGLYIEEAMDQLANYQIVATSSGTITAISDFLMQNIYVAGNNLITQACGTGNYSVTTTEDYDFGVGDVYTAVSGLFSYELKISDVTEQTDSYGNVSRRLTFEPLSDMSGVSDADTLYVTIEKPTLHNVTYVDASCVYKSQDGYFVYVVDEEGYRSVVPVTCGDVVGSNIVITEGLKAGEKVSLN